MSGCCARTKNSAVKWRNAKVRLPNTKSKSRTPKSKSRTPKSKSPIWSGNWLDGRRTLPTPPSHLPPTDWPESRDRAAESTRASASRVPSPDIRGIIDPCFPRPQRAPLRPGHPGHHRPLLPSAAASAIEVLLPKQCGHCGASLPQEPGKVTTAGDPRRHQVTEVPPVKAHITEYQFPNVVCGHCEKATRAPLPEEIAGQFGPQLTALIAYWTVVCRLPRRLVEAMLADVLGIGISLGSTQKAWEEV